MTLLVKIEPKMYTVRKQKSEICFQITAMAVACNVSFPVYYNYKITNSNCNVSFPVYYNYKITNSNLG